MVNDATPASRRTDLLDQIAEFCGLAVTRTGTDGMAVSLRDTLGNLEPILETDGLAEKVSSIQFTLGEGPGCDALVTGEPVAVGDLRTFEASQRWPAFAPEAVGLGIGALYAFPLGSAGVVLGSAMLYRVVPGDLDERQVRQAAVASDLLGLALVAPGQGSGMSAGIRMVVHQAAGMVMQQNGGSIADALILLKATAFGENRQVTELAAEVVARERHFSPIVGNEDGGTT